jgi:integrase
MSTLTAVSRVYAVAVRVRIMSMVANGRVGVRRATARIGCRSSRTRDDTKSRAGRRTVGLPAALVQLLRMHRVERDRERIAACQLRSEGGWVFTTPTGQPINPNADYHHWKQLFRDAGVRDLHDARHTAATVLLILGVPERAVMGIMGWSSTAMAAWYQHITDRFGLTSHDGLDGLIWDGGDAGPDQAPDAK